MPDGARIAADTDTAGKQLRYVDPITPFREVARTWCEANDIEHDSQSPDASRRNGTDSALGFGSGLLASLAAAIVMMLRLIPEALGSFARRTR